MVLRKDSFRSQNADPPLAGKAHCSTAKVSDAKSAFSTVRGTPIIIIVEAN